MDLAYITPTRFINQFGNQGDFHLALAHLMDRSKENEYERLLKESEKRIVLDNGLFELHHPEGIDSLIAKARRIGATHFFAPDFLYSAKQTFAALKNTLYILDLLKEEKLKIAVVVQAETEEEFFELYDKFLKEPRVDLIGISILAVPRCFGSWNKTSHKKNEVYEHKDEEIVPSRIKLLEKLLERGGNTKNLHLLGLGASYEDVIFAKENCPFVVSNDTSSCFQSGLHGRLIWGNQLIVEGGKVKEKLDFDLKEISEDQIECIQRNINQVKMILK